MPRSRSESVSGAKTATRTRSQKLAAPAEVAKPAAAARRRKPSARPANAPQRAAPVARAAKPAAPPAPVIAAPPPPAPVLAAPVPTPPPAPPVQARQTPVMRLVLARLWAMLSAFVRGPGRAMAIVTLKAIGAMLAWLWTQLRTALRRMRSKPKSPRADNAAIAAAEEAESAPPPPLRIPPHQRHLYAQANSC